MMDQSLICLVQLYHKGLPLGSFAPHMSTHKFIVMLKYCSCVWGEKHMHDASTLAHWVTQFHHKARNRYHMTIDAHRT